MNIEFHIMLSTNQKHAIFLSFVVYFRGGGVAYQKNVRSDFEPLEVVIALIGSYGVHIVQIYHGGYNSI